MQIGSRAMAWIWSASACRVSKQDITGKPANWIVQHASRQKLTKRVANCWDPTRGAAATPADIHSNILHIIHMDVIHMSSPLGITSCWLNESGLSAINDRMASNVQHTCSCDQHMPSSALLPGSMAAETSTAIYTGLHGAYIEHEQSTGWKKASCGCCYSRYRPDVRSASC